MLIWSNDEGGAPHQYHEDCHDLQREILLPQDSVGKIPILWALGSPLSWTASHSWTSSGQESSQGPDFAVS